MIGGSVGATGDSVGGATGGSVGGVTGGSVGGTTGALVGTITGVGWKKEQITKQSGECDCECECNESRKEECRCTDSSSPLESAGWWAGRESRVESKGKATDFRQ